jgi:RNA polymerase I-specific transcription initiation factor RRN7
MLQPEDLHNAISDLGTIYHQTFGLTLPPLNHELLLFKYIMYLALPLEIFTAVQELAQLTQSHFHYSSTKDTRRRQGSAFPEIKLMSLLVISVKLLYPFDGAQRLPRSIQEPTTQKLDWMSWKRHQQEFGERPPPASLARGSEIDVRDTDVFKMSRQELDSYMDWYQKTWVREPRPGTEGSVNREIRDMFPLHSLGQSVQQAQIQREQEVQNVATERARTTTASIKFQRPIADEEIINEGVDIKRPGEDYRSYRDEEHLPETAKTFFAVAAKTACTTVKNLIIAVLQIEARIAAWKRAKRRAEVTGLDFDLDAELLGGGVRVETQMSREVDAMDIQEEVVEVEDSTGSGGEDGDADMQMIS